MAYEKANVKSGRLFVTEAEKLQENPKLPALNGTIMVDGVVLYLGLWKRQSKNGGTYYTAELTYPKDEEARLKATGKATSKAAAKEREWDEAHPKTEGHARSQWAARPQNRQPSNDPVENQGSDGDSAGGDDDMPF